MVGLLEQYKVIFGHLESIFAFSQSLGKKQKCLRLAWMNWNIIISKLEGIFSICKSSLKRVQYCTEFKSRIHCTGLSIWSDSWVGLTLIWDFPPSCHLAQPVLLKSRTRQMVEQACTLSFMTCCQAPSSFFISGAHWKTGSCSTNPTSSAPCCSTPRGWSGPRRTMGCATGSSTATTWRSRSREAIQ